MSEFNVKIVTPDGELFSGALSALLVTAETGEVQILRGHVDFFAPLKTGKAKLTLPDGSVRYAASSGGFISVRGGEAMLVATTFEFGENIDKARAERAREAAEEKIKTAKTDSELKIAKAKLERAIARLSVSSK